MSLIKFTNDNKFLISCTIKGDILMYHIKSSKLIARTNENQSINTPIIMLDIAYNNKLNSFSGSV